MTQDAHILVVDRGSRVMTQLIGAAARALPTRVEYVLVEGWWL